MKEEYRIYCKCIEDIIKFIECEDCPHYRKGKEEYCIYTDNQE